MSLEFTTQLIENGLDPASVILLRHRPPEVTLNRAFRFLVTTRPDLFNAYQQTQNSKLESAMAMIEGNGYIASFIAHAPGKALFVGLYKIAGSTPISYGQYLEMPVNKELFSLGMEGLPAHRSSILFFDLELSGLFSDWKGRLIISWPPPDRSWWRRGHKGSFPISAILEDSALERDMAEWHELNLSWTELGCLPAKWRAKLAEWRAIYYIFDSSDRMGYVGSAYGSDNLLGRWLGYAKSGHGGNRLLKQRDPKNFRFSILQRVSPDSSSDEVIRLESTWKERLHTRAPNGLNDN